MRLPDYAARHNGTEVVGYLFSGLGRTNVLIRWVRLQGNGPGEWTPHPFSETDSCLELFLRKNKARLPRSADENHLGCMHLKYVERIEFPAELRLVSADLSAAALSAM